MLYFLFFLCCRLEYGVSSTYVSRERQHRGWTRRDLRAPDSCQSATLSIATLVETEMPKQKDRYGEGLAGVQ